VLASLVAGAVFVISFAAGVALVIIFPTLAAEYAEPIPAKYLLVQLNLIVSALAAFIVYCSCANHWHPGSSSVF
jgi:hypothetical protein